MKAETLLTLLKKCVLCLFLCVLAKDGFGQVSDSAIISYGVTGNIVELATSYEKEFTEGINLSGDSSIIRYIPSYYQKNDSKNRYRLENLVTNIKGDKLSIQYDIIGMYGDLWSGTTTNVVLSMDSLHKYYVVPIYPEEESFWDDTLQPILVTAGAAAVIALFFFVKF